MRVMVALVMASLGVAVVGPVQAQQRTARPAERVPGERSVPIEQQEVRTPDRVVGTLPSSRQALAGRTNPVEPASVIRSAPRIRTVSEDNGVTVFEVTAEWNGSLADEVRRYGADPDQLVWRAVGGWPTISARVQLGAYRTPQVDVLAAEFDEVPLGARSVAELVPEDAEAALSRLQAPAAQVVSVGEERWQPTGTLVAQLLTIDAERRMVRRYRRLLLAVRTGQTGGWVGASASRGGGTNPHVAVTRSALAEGTFYKIPITEEGIYRIDRDYLGRLGVDVETLSPSRLQIFHNGGAALPELNSDPRPADLLENPVYVEGGSDGSFDEGDALYFFAEAPRGWTWDPIRGWDHTLNYFTRQSYVFLRVDGSNGARIGGGAFPSWPDAQRQTNFNARLFVEEDLLNIVRSGGGSGLEWLGARGLTGAADTHRAGHDSPRACGWRGPVPRARRRPVAGRDARVSERRARAGHALSSFF